MSIEKLAEYERGFKPKMQSKSKPAIGKACDGDCRLDWDEVSWTGRFAMSTNRCPLTQLDSQVRDLALALATMAAPRVAHGVNTSHN